MSNNNNYTSVLVGNVSTEATAETLSGFFGFCGEIRDIELRSGTHEAVIKFGTHEAAETACMLTDTPVLDQSITVAPFVSDGESSGPAPKEDEAEKEKEEKKVEEASNDTNAQEAKDGKEEEEVKTETPEAAEAEIPEKKNAAEEEAETTEQKSAEISEKPEEKSPSTPADTPADSDSTDDSEAMKADVLHAIGDVVADGYYLKEGFKKKAQEYDESLGISKGVKDTVAAVDSTLGLSTMLGQASTFVSGQFKKIDEQAGLSKIATTAVSEANDLVNVVSENSYVSSTFSLFRGWGSSIAKAYNAIYNESAAAIEARQKEEAEEEDKEVVEEENNNGNDGDDEKDSTDEKEGVNCTKTN